MKLKLPILFVALCCFSWSYGQISNFNVGMDVYTNYNNYDGEGRYIQKMTAKPSVTVGVVLTYQINNKLSFESGLKYVNRGHREESGANSYYYLDNFFIDDYYYASPYNETATHNYNYLSVPLNFRVALNSDPNKGWYLRFGFATDFYLSSKTRNEVSINEDVAGPDFPENDPYLLQPSYEDNSSDIRKTHLNLNYGIGYSFLFDNQYQVSVEPAFEYMFYKMYHKGGEFSYNSFGIKLRFLVL